MQLRLSFIFFSNCIFKFIYSWDHFLFDILPISKLSSCSTGGFLATGGAGVGVMSTKPVPHLALYLFW